MPQQFRRSLIFSLVFATAVYLALTIYGDAPQLARSLGAWDWHWLPLALGVTLLNYLVRFARWHNYLRVLGLTQVRLWPSLMIFLSGFSLTMVPGKLGELIKSGLLKAHYEILISYSASLVAAERLLDAMAMTLLAAVGLAILPGGWAAVAVTAFGLMALVVVLQWRSLAERLLQLLERIPGIGRLAPIVRNLYASAFLLLRWRPLLVALGLSVVAWFGECLALFFILLGFGITPDAQLLLTATFIYAASSLFGAATLLPAGIGATEGSMAGLLQVLIHVPATTAAAATLLVRACTLWFAILIGVVALLVVRVPQEASRQSAERPTI